MNLFDYVAWRGDISFEAAPYNKVDALVFSHIIYMHFHDLISSDFNERITIKELAEKFRNTSDYDERTNLGVGINPKTVQLFFDCADTVRFGNVEVGGFRCVYDEVKCEQFAAATFYIDKNAFVCYRGTDDTIIGWKEDFLLAYMDPFPSQTDALLYFEDAVKANPDMNFILSGHSKGGNLALYTSVNTSKENQEKISKIYNLDGPGFVDEFFEKPEFKNIEPVLVNIYPEDDYVGMLQKHSKNFEIIKCNGKGIAQHDPLNWNVLGNKFVSGAKFTDASQFFYRTINDWSNSMTNEEKERFVTALFDIYLASECKTNYELSQNLIPASKKIIKAYNDMDKDTKKEVKRLINLLKKSVKSELPIFNMFAKIPLEPKENKDDGGNTDIELAKNDNILKSKIEETAAKTKASAIAAVKAIEKKIKS